MSAHSGTNARLFGMKRAHVFVKTRRSFREREMRLSGILEKENT